MSLCRLAYHFCRICVSHVNSWKTCDLSPLHKTNVKSAIHNTIDYYAEITARGIVRGDAMIRDLPHLNALEKEFDSSILLYQRLPDPMHLLENISQAVYKHFEASINSKTMKLATELIRTATGITKLTGLVPSYRWRLIWGSYPVTWVVALIDPKYAVHRSIVMLLSLVASILYAKPEHRDTVSWLRLIGASFLLHRSLASAGVNIRLSEHLLWPHMPAVYAIIDGYNISCESHEYLWKAVRKVWPAINPTASDAVTQLVARLCAQNYARYLRVDKRDRRSHALLYKWWKEQRVERMHFTGDASALVGMLQQFGFVEGESWHRETGRVVLHTASIDPPIRAPRPPSLSESVTIIIERHTRYVYSTPSIANAHDIASRSTAVVPPKPKLVPKSSAAGATAVLSASDDDDLYPASVDDADSSDDDYRPGR